VDVTLASDTTQVRRLNDREQAFAAGTTVELGPNDLLGCDPGFEPIMYFVRVLLQN
jgi:hypothetical protein